MSQENATFVNVRMDDADAALLDALCKRPLHPQLTRSQALRWCLHYTASAHEVEVPSDEEETR